MEKFRKEKEDLSVFTEPGIANDAKKPFQQIDATVDTVDDIPTTDTAKRIEADKAKSLRAKFENWDTDLRNNKRNEDDEEEDFLPKVDTIKNLRAKFEAIKEDSIKSAEKLKPKVNRFIVAHKALSFLRHPRWSAASVLACDQLAHPDWFLSSSTSLLQQEQATVNTDICSLCGKKVYPMEKMETSGMRIHKNCFRCTHCSCMLRLGNYTKSGRNLYCTPHFKQLFLSRGNYDEGFGREQHKDKWNRSCNNTPVPRDLNEDVELSNGDAQCLEQTV